MPDRFVVAARKADMRPGACGTHRNPDIGQCFAKPAIDALAGALKSGFPAASHAQRRALAVLPAEALTLLALQAFFLGWIAD